MGVVVVLVIQVIVRVLGNWMGTGQENLRAIGGCLNFWQKILFEGESGGPPGGSFVERQHLFGAGHPMVGVLTRRDQGMHLKIISGDGF